MENLTDLIMKFAKNVRVPKAEYPKRVYNLLKELGYDPDIIKYIHITGSKGKGSLAKTCFQLLKNTNYKIGLFTSPHIFDIQERFVTNEGEIKYKQLYLLINRFLYIFEKSEFHFFEICLFLGIIYFIEQKCTIIILEVGVGGRFDPTNFCKPMVSLLGNISIEHKDFLGDTIEKIAFDKAGIIKKDIPAFSVNQEEIVKIIFQQEGKVLFYNDIIEYENRRILEDYSVEFDLIIYLQKKIILPNIILNRIGEANIRNFSLACVAILNIFPDLSCNMIYEAAKEKISYRMELYESNILIDTAHNGISFDNLMNTIDYWLKWNKITLYITLLEGKEIGDIIKVLNEYHCLIDKIYTFDFECPSIRRSQGYRLYEYLKNDFVVEYIDNLEKIKFENNKDDRYIFVGSFYSIPIVTNLLKPQI